MENTTHYIGVTLALGLLVWGVIGFFRGLSLPRNDGSSQHYSNGDSV